jgi:hypothetical protein
MNGAIGEPNALAMLFFFVFIAASLGITWFAARRTKTTEDFYAAGRSVTAVQNGLALAGDYERGQLPRPRRPRSTASSTRSASWSAGRSSCS